MRRLCAAGWRGLYWLALAALVLGYPLLACFGQRVGTWLITVAMCCDEKAIGGEE